MSFSTELTKKTVEEISNYEDLIEIIKKNSKVVVDFYASWCNPCKRIMPEYEKMSDEFNKAKFVKVNIENLDEEELEHLNIGKFPTFVFTKSNFTDGKIEKMRYQGSNEEELRNKLTSYLSL
jgi:thioredoxin 1